MTASFNISVSLPATYEPAAEIIIQDKEELQHEIIILQDGEYKCKVATILGIGATVKSSCVKVKPTDGGGGMAVKVESSYELIMPGPRVEQAQVQDENNNIAGTCEVGGASTSKVKMD